MEKVDQISKLHFSTFAFVKCRTFLQTALQKERKSKIVSISFILNDVHVSGCNPEMFHSFKRYFYFFSLYIFFPIYDKYNSRWQIFFDTGNLTIVVITFLLWHCLHKNSLDLNITALVLLFFPIEVHSTTVHLFKNDGFKWNRKEFMSLL